MKTLRICQWLCPILCLLILSAGLLAGCDGGNDLPSQTTDSSEGIEDVTRAETTASEVENDCDHQYMEQSNEATCTERGVTTLVCTLCGHSRKKLSNPLGHDYVDYVCRREGCGHINIFYASDFGAVGDGVTDDGPAICEAVNAAASSGGMLIFEEKKTYYVGTSTTSADSFVTPFALRGVSGVTIDGRDSTFCMAPELTYLVIRSSANVTVKNCNFDYAVPVYLVGTVTAVNDKTVTYSVDVEPYTDYYDYSGITAFSVKAKSGVQNYAQGFIKSMTKTGSREITVVHSSGVGNYRVGDAVYLPNPGVGHVGSEAFYIGQNTGDLIFENIEVRAARNFVFSVKSNKGDVCFKNVDLAAGESNTRALKMVAWRDGFHCKDNRGAMHWTDCENGVLFDDVFNIRNTLGAIESVTDKVTFRAIDYGHSTAEQTSAFNCQAGDVLDFYDQYNDVYYGYATVLSATRSGGVTVVVLETDDGTVDLTGVDLANCRIGNRTTCAPNSTIENCKFSGSFRFSRDLTVENTEFHLLSLWILAEGGSEGPIPGNITFRNCAFHYGYIQIDGYNRWDTGAYMPNIGAQIRGIRLYDCTMTDGCYFRTQTGGRLEVYQNGVLQSD